jgi:hypothetical protein
MKQQLEMTQEEKEAISDDISRMLFSMFEMRYKAAHSESTKRGIAASKARRMETEAKSNSLKK